jgi:hypothetical protein
LEYLARLRDLIAERANIGQLVTPDEVKEAVDRNDLIGVHQQRREKCTLSRCSGCHRPPVVDHL